MMARTADKLPSIMSNMCVFTSRTCESEHAASTPSGGCVSAPLQRRAADRPGVGLRQASGLWPNIDPPALVRAQLL